MSTRMMLGNSGESFSHPDISKTIASLEENLGDIVEKTADISGSFDSAVVFANIEGDPVATPIATLDAPGSNSYQRFFRDSSVMDRRLLVHGTALGRSLESRHEPLFAPSTINPDFQMTYTHPLQVGDTRVGAVQYSFTEHYDGEGLEVPDSRDLQGIWADHSDNVAALAAGVAGLHKLAREKRKALPVMMRKKPTLAPNSFLIRWDTVGSTEMNDDYRQPLLDEFLNDAHLTLADLAAEYSQDPAKSRWAIREAYSDQGDGAYVALMIPKKFNTYDAAVLKDYRHYTATRFMGEMARRLDALIASQPAGFLPQVEITGDFAYSEANSVGRLSSATMYDLAKKQKQK